MDAKSQKLPRSTAIMADVLIVTTVPISELCLGRLLRRPDTKSGKQATGVKDWMR